MTAPMTSLRRGQAIDYTRLFALGAIWGSAFMLMAVALKGFPPFAVAALRVMIGATALTLMGLVLREAWPRGLQTWRRIALVGLFNTALPFSLITWGLQGVEAGRAAILMATVPFVTLLLSHVTSHDDRISGFKLFGLTLGISGVVLVIGLDAVTAGGQSIVGQLSIMGAASCYAISNVLTRRLSHLSPVLGTGAMMLTACVYMAPLLVFLWWPESLPASWEPYAALLTLGVAPTAIAYVLRFQLIRDVGSTFMSQVGYLVPVFGVLWAWAILAEQPGWTTFLALALILGGVRVTQIRRGGA